MYKQNFFLLLCAVGLAQYSHGRSLTTENYEDVVVQTSEKDVSAITTPITSRSDAPEPVLLEDSTPAPTSATAETLGERAKLLVFVLQQYYVQDNVILKAGKDYLQELLDELNTWEDSSDKANATIEELTSFVRKVESYEQSPNVIDSNDLVNELGSLLDPNSADDEEEDEEEWGKTPDAKVIDILLKDFGSYAIETVYEKSFLDFMDKFHDAADKFWNSLTPQQQAEEQAFHDWYKQIQQETDVKMKWNLFQNIFNYLYKKYL